MTSINESVISSFYASALKCKGDSLSEAGKSCCSPLKLPSYYKKVLELVPEKVRELSFGCSYNYLYGAEGLYVLDLGSGPGRDCYVAAHEVGKNGKVVGVDLTDDMLKFAESHIEEYSKTLGYKPDMKFVKGNIQDLTTAGISSNSVDIVISNCVVNLTHSKEAVLKTVFDVLKEGGEFQLLDIFSSMRLPEEAKCNESLVSNCIGGALYFADFIAIAQKVGFGDIRIINMTEVPITEEKDKEKLNGATIFSMSFRLFKISQIEPNQEDYGDVATYVNPMRGSELQYEFDCCTTFPINKSIKVDRKTATVLKNSWLSKYFDVDMTSCSHKGPYLKYSNNPVYYIAQYGKAKRCC